MTVGVRKFTGGDGSDTTSATIAFLRSTNKIRFADLILIGELEDPMADFLTNWEAPLTWPIWGTFKPAVINRGILTSQIGLQVDTLELKWSPKFAAFGNSISTANKYQLAQSGFYDNKQVRVWRAVMPSAGDVNTYGACELFKGRVGSIQISRGQIVLEVNSYLDVVNQIVPPNLIELTNTLASYAGNTPVVSDSETTLPQFTVVAPSNTTIILGQCTAPSAGKIYGTDKFKAGFIAFNRGSSLEGYWSPIGANSNFNAGGGVHYNQFNVYGAFPWAPVPGDTFYASIKPPMNLQEAAAGFGYFGFPYVPAPETAV